MFQVRRIEYQVYSDLNLPKRGIDVTVDVGWPLDTRGLGHDQNIDLRHSLCKSLVL